MTPKKFNKMITRHFHMKLQINFAWWIIGWKTDFSLLALRLTFLLMNTATLFEQTDHFLRCKTHEMFCPKCRSLILASHGNYQGMNTVEVLYIIAQTDYFVGRSSHPAFYYHKSRWLASRCGYYIISPSVISRRKWRLANKRELAFEHSWLKGRTQTCQPH